MEKAYIQRYNNMHMIHKTFTTYKCDYIDNLTQIFRPPPEVVAYDMYFVDPKNGLERFWDEYFHDQNELEYKGTCNKPNDQIENEDL